MRNIIKSFKKAIFVERIAKYNDNHDERGRFAEKGSGKRFSSEREKILSLDSDSDKAVFLIDAGAITRDEMLSLFRAGRTDDAVNRYFDILDQNGDPSPTKETRPQIVLPMETEDWTGTRISTMKELTGFDDRQAVKTKNAFDRWTSGANLSDKEKETIEAYIEKAPAYDGKMYRGMHFEDDYGDFKAHLKTGESFSLGGLSSWSSDVESARIFAHTADDTYHSVLITCVANKSATPIEYLNGTGEGEVIAGSKARWTVLHMEETTTSDGHKKLFVTCVEKEERIAKSFLQIIEKYNPCHDRLGRFCSAGSVSVGTDLSKYKKMIREKNPPKKTVRAYKAFIVKDGKLYPPMVANPDALDTPVGVWLDAQEGVRAGKTKTGRDQVRSGGKGTKGGSGKLAYRPGWHLGDIPLATQFYTTNEKTGVKETYENLVFAECEIAADVDYQKEAMSYGYNKKGNFQHSLAGLPKIPEDGYYRYRTNPDPKTRDWYITGAMKVGKILTDEQCARICHEAGERIMPRAGGELTKEKLVEMGIDPSMIKEDRSGNRGKAA